MLRRRLLGALSVLSLILSIAILLLWMNSYRTARWLYYTHNSFTVVNGRPWTHPTNYGILLRRGTLQADRWLNGDIHNHQGDPVVTKFGVPVDAGWSSGCRGGWDWGSVGLRNEWGDVLLIFRIDPQEPQATWGPFGWSTTLYPPLGLYNKWQPPPTGVRNSIFLPVWPPFLLTLIPPILLVRKLGWAAYRRRRAARTGHCTNCGYDLRATTDKCPECGAVARVQLRRDENLEEIAMRLQQIE
jgi:hypothetical protein